MRGEEVSELDLYENYSTECKEAEKACCVSSVGINSGSGGMISSGTTSNVGDICSTPTIPQSTCACGFWELLCTDHPGPACDYAAGWCCGSPKTGCDDPHCHCEVNKFAESLDYKMKYDACPLANTGSRSNSEEEKKTAS